MSDIQFPRFKATAAVGTTVAVGWHGFTIRARIEDDPTDYFPEGHYDAKQLRAYKRGEWHMVRVVISLHLRDVVVNPRVAETSPRSLGCFADDVDYLTASANTVLDAFLLSIAHDALAHTLRLIHTAKDLAAVKRSVGPSPSERDAAAARAARIEELRFKAEANGWGHFPPVWPGRYATEYQQIKEQQEAYEHTYG